MLFRILEMTCSSSICDTVFSCMKCEYDSVFSQIIFLTFSILGIPVALKRPYQLSLSEKYFSQLLSYSIVTFFPVYYSNICYKRVIPS